MLLRTTHFLPRELAERQFLLKFSRVLAPWGALKQTLRVCLRACFKINEPLQTVFKLISPKAAELSGGALQSRTILPPQPALFTNRFGFVNNAG